MSLLFIQLPVPSFVPLKNTGNLPLASATLALYIRNKEGHLGRPRLLPQLEMSHAGDARLLRLITKIRPKTVAFSLFVWNIERSAWLIQEVKRMLPDTRVIIGGPEVTADNPLIKKIKADDSVVGEGEPALDALLKNQPLKKLNFVSSFEDYKDPFICGLVKAEPNGVWYAEFQRGCRYSCRYCRYHQGRGGVLTRKSPEQMAAFFKAARENLVKEIYLLDPSIEQQPDFPAFLRLLAKINRNPVIPLFVEARLDLINPECIPLMKKAGIRSLEAGLQSLNPAVLRTVGRSLNWKLFLSNALTVKKMGLKLQLDAMIGLPGETKKSFNAGLEQLKKVGLIKHLQLFRTQALPGTTLRQEAKKFGIVYDKNPPYEIVETANWTKESLQTIFSETEKRYNVSFAPEERFSVPARPSIGSLSFERREGGSIWGVSCTPQKMTKRADRLLERAWESVASSVVVRLRVHSPVQSIEPVLTQIRQLIAKNPFASLSLVIESDLHASLELWDALIPVLKQEPRNRVLEKLYEALPERSIPCRRLYTLLPFSMISRISKDWLNEVRTLSEIVWLTNDDALKNASNCGSTKGEWLLVSEKAAKKILARKPFASNERILCESSEMVWKLAE